MLSLCWLASASGNTCKNKDCLETAGKVYSKADLLAVGEEKLDKANADALAWVIEHESKGKTTAKNPKSTAFGIGQIIKSNRERFALVLGVSPDTTNYEDQLKMTKMYMRTRYGSAVKAKEHWEKHKSY